MSDMQCPYCEADQEVCHDDGHGYAEGVKHEHRCSECDKTFTFETTIVFYYEAEKADCLNGAEHDLTFRKSWPKEYSRMSYKHCEHERRATPEEIDAWHNAVLTGAGQEATGNGVPSHRVRLKT